MGVFFLHYYIYTYIYDTYVRRIGFKTLEVGLQSRSGSKTLGVRVRCGFLHSAVEKGLKPFRNGYLKQPLCDLRSTKTKAKTKMNILSISKTVASASRSSQPFLAAQGYVAGDGEEGGNDPKYKAKRGGAIRAQHSSGTRFTALSR